MRKLLICFNLLFLFSCSEKLEETKPTIGDLTESVYASGVIKSEQQFQVFSKANGILRQLLVEEGDIVSKNQALFAISNETSKLSRENAELQAEFAALNNNSDKLKDAKLAIEFAKVKMLTDSINYIRQQALHSQNVVSKTVLEQAELLYQNSKTSYKSAQIRYSELKKQLQLTDEQAKRNLQISQTLEGDFTVKSELKGKVYAILKEQGEMVNTQTPLAIIGDASNFKIELQIDEDDVARIQKNQRIIVTLDSYKNETFEAYISKIYPYLNERSKTFTVEARFKNKPSVLYPNLSLEANIIIAQKPQALVIPRKFLVDENFVVLKSGEKKKVKLGLKDLEKVEILNGISKNDVLILQK